METIQIADIDVRGRTRKEMGDIVGLAASIERLGLLHPVVVTADNKLVVGRRRIEAFKKLGRTEIPVNVVHNLDELALLLEAERDENTCRKSYVPSEAVEIGERIEALAVKLAKAAQKAAGGDKKSEAAKSLGGNSPKRFEPQKRDESKRTTSQAAAAVGVDRRTYEKAKAVVEAAKADPKRHGDLTTTMDKTGKVSQAYQELKRREKRVELEAKAAAAPAPAAGEPTPREPSKSADTSLPSATLALWHLV